MGKSRLVWSRVHPCIYILPRYSMGPMDGEGVVSILAESWCMSKRAFL